MGKPTEKKKKPSYGHPQAPANAPAGGGGPGIARPPAPTGSIGDVLNLKETLARQGDPRSDPNYINNAIASVELPIWGGPFFLYPRQPKASDGSDVLVLERNEFRLDQDPLSGAAGSINQVYLSREAAQASVLTFGIAGIYSFYVGPHGYIYPTIISDTTAPELCKALRAKVAEERENAKAAEKLGIDLALWYVGARFPMKVSTGASSAGTAALSKAGPRLVMVEIGAGDLKASIELARKGVNVIAVEPDVASASASAVKEFKSLGGTVVRGTAQNVKPGIADHVFQYFPWRIGGSGSHVSGGTWRLIDDTVKLLKPGGAAHFVTEDYATALRLAEDASSKGLKVALTETTAGAAASGASGAGVPNFSSSLKVWMVNLYR